MDLYYIRFLVLSIQGNMKANLMGIAVPRYGIESRPLANNSNLSSSFCHFAASFSSPTHTAQHTNTKYKQYIEMYTYMSIITYLFALIHRLPQCLLFFLLSLCGLFLFCRLRRLTFLRTSSR